jgi:hypothetical protein
VADAARITVTRNDPKDVRDRQIVVSIDGEPFGTLLFGDSITREAAPGPHTLRAHNTLFWKTLQIDLRPGQQARFIVINRGGTGSWALLGLLGVGPLYLTFERDSRDAP